MNQHPDRLVQLIERRMAGPSYNKTEEEKANELFDYQPRPDPDNIKLADAQANVSFVSHQQAEVALKEIFNFYVNAYALLSNRQCYAEVNQKSTFEQITHQHLIMDFQAFLLFCRQFRLVSQVFPVNSIRVIFKKHSNFGKSLTFEDFVNIVNSMAHEKESVAYFGGTAQEAVNREAVDEGQLQHLYNYLGLGERDNFRGRFRPVVEAFDSSSKLELARIPYHYKKLSQPELLSKAFHRRRPSQTSIPVTKSNKRSQSEKQLKPINQNLISWEVLQKRQPSLEKLSKVRAMVQEEDDDKIYLQEFVDRKKQRTDSLKEEIRKRIDMLTKNDEQRQKRILDKLNQRTFVNELL